MKKLIVGIVLMMTALWLLCSVPAAAVERVGSVTFHMTYQEQTLSGGDLHLCRFAEPDEDSFCWTEDFADCELHLFEYTDARFAQDLLSYLNDYNSEKEKSEEPIIAYDTKLIADDGTVRFDMLQRGLYLFWQTEPCDGYELLSPFVVSVPMVEDGVEVYEINASPKVNPQPITPPAQSETTVPTDGKERLPQTGMLMWPIPGFFLYGTFFVLLGFIIRMD